MISPRFSPMASSIPVSSSTSHPRFPARPRAMLFARSPVPLSALARMNVSDQHLFQCSLPQEQLCMPCCAQTKEQPLMFRTALCSCRLPFHERQENPSATLAVDCLVRYLYPDKRDVYTYWAYFRNARQRNIGWRLDYFLVSAKLQDSICDVVVQNGVYGSDHCPVVLLLAV